MNGTEKRQNYKPHVNPKIHRLLGLVSLSLEGSIDVGVSRSRTRMGPHPVRAAPWEKARCIRRKAAESSHLGQDSVSLAQCEKLQWRVLISSCQRIYYNCSVPDGLQSCVPRGILGAHGRTVGFSSAELIETLHHGSRNAMVDK